MTPDAPSLDSVATINEDGSRRFIHPSHVRGRFTALRTLAAVALMAVYILLPWIPVNGNPAVFFDVRHLQFHLFGLTFVTQDLWMAFFGITGLGFTLFYVTALFGRIWCGWACPETVFLDIVRRVERWIEGDAPARRRLDASPMTLSKTGKRFVKHLFYAVFAFGLAHMFLSYFVSLPKLYGMMSHSPFENWGAFLFVFAMGVALWFNFAWFREQFCIVLCPYGRLQSVLTDPDTMVIGYDAGRGEPRGKKGTPGAGDCIECRRCVQVCPTGIDIRQGLQIECIGCAACIDACDAVMDKVGRPRGLVRYDSSKGLAGGKTRWVRPRTLFYTALLLLGATVMSVGFSTFRPVTVTLVRMTGAPYYLDETGGVRNQFMLRAINKRNAAAAFRVEFVGAPEGLQFSGWETPVAVPPLEEQVSPLVITLPRAAFRREIPLRVRVVDAEGRVAAEKTVPFLGPSLP